MKNNEKNNFRIRIYDDDLLSSINELYKTNRFNSMNDLLSKAIAKGIEDIYVEFGKKKNSIKSKEKKIKKAV